MDVILHRRINTNKIQEHNEYNSNHGQCPPQRNVGFACRQVYRGRKGGWTRADIGNTDFPQKAYELGKNL